MDLKSPITLSGSNLKDRHRNLNSLVNQAHKKNIAFEDVVQLPEISAVDRIFKLELASKFAHVEYIMKNLKDDDMVYVGKALKCLWLLEPQYSYIINPVYLESTLYPEMIQPAVNKMKRWIRLHLRDKKRCQEFYAYYKSNFGDAFHYFWHCSNEFIMSEFPNVIDKLSPKQLKIVFEICPSACKIYFEILPNNRAALTKYVNDSRNYFNTIKYIMKRDSNLFMDIVEKYFDRNRFAPFGPSITQHIMKHFRSRFEVKSELYASALLHMNTLASNLSTDQAKELVLRLARAEYLYSWFSYKKVEPLIKRLRPEERSLLKKQVFVDKNIEHKVKEWPYSIPEPLFLEVEEQKQFFTDIEHEPYEYEDYHYDNGFGRCKKSLLKKRKFCYQSCDIVCVGKSPLDQLFNRYRFFGFEQTFYELSKNLLAESTIEGRLNMMLVLVSKSGGVTEHVENLLKFLLERHRNETSTLRAAVVRSFVKRGCVWRLPENVFQLLLEFGRDIGLDGAKTDPSCREGLHAVVLHKLLSDMTMSPSLLDGFIRNFTTFAEYKLKPEERTIISKRLPSLILPLDANAFLETLVQYKINIEDIINAKPILLKAAKSDTALVTRLYKAKILRRELFSETFAIRQNNASYINALRHDTSLLENGKKFANLVAKECSNHARFLKSLCIYFGENGGLAEQHRICLEEAFLTNPKIWITRSLCCLLSNEELSNLLVTYESERPISKEQLLMLSGLRANSHNAKPPLDVNAYDWKWLGAKAVANKALICRRKDQDTYIKKLLEWRRTARIAVVISVTSHLCVETFIDFSSLRPLAAVKIALTKYLTKDYIEPRIWDAVKMIIENKDISKNQRLLWKLSEPRHISKNILADYWLLIYNIFTQIDHKKAMPMLCRLENILPDVDSHYVKVLINQFIEKQLDPNIFFKDEDDGVYSINIKCLYVRIIAKHLLLCTSAQAQLEAIENVCGPFFNAIEILLERPESKVGLIKILNDFIYSLKYSKVFISKQYVSCLPLFQRVLTRMRKILPVEEHFGKYVEIHLTMLYCKTIKQVEKLKPNIFETFKDQNEVIEIVGRIFGKYIGYEIKELIAKYFHSIVDLYKVNLLMYLKDYFQFSNSSHLFITFVIKGLLETDTKAALILAEYIYQKEQTYHIPEPHCAEILEVLKKSSDEEIKYFLYADVF